VIVFPITAEANAHVQEGVIKICRRELTRYDVFMRVLDGTINLKDAAGCLGR
jgi:hypothetical protein